MPTAGQSPDCPATECPSEIKIDERIRRDKGLKLTKRTDTLQQLHGVKPFGILECEAAALCGMSVGAFTARCTLAPALVGKRRLYVYDEVQEWFKGWHMQSQGAPLTLRRDDWVEASYGQNANR